MSEVSPAQIAAHFEFARLATQYHSTGRFAALAHCIPVAGNLLHHAIEMYIKCVLVKTLTLAELKRLGHDLNVLWQEFERTHPDIRDDSITPFIAELQKFERLRYPDSVVVDGMQVSFVLEAAHFSRLPDGPQPAYHLVLEEIDRVAQIAVRVSGLQMICFTSGLSEQAVYYLKLNNSYPIDEVC